MIMKRVPSYVIDNCINCAYSVGFETHSEDEALCFHEKFPNTHCFNDLSGKIPDWCPLEDEKL